MPRQPYSVAVPSTGGRLHPSFLRREGLVRMWSSLWLKGDGGIRKNFFTHFIRDRYNLSYNVSNWIHETNDDIKPLEKLKEKVDEVSKTEKYIRKAAFMNLSKSLDGAIMRCKGDMHAKPF